jgi:hypothetical protein
VRLGGENFLIGLAPYFLPTLAFLLLPLPALLRGEFVAPVLALIGFATAYHVCSTVYETRPSQPDIAKAGRLFSLLFLPVANLVCYGALIAFAAGGYGGLRDYLEDGLAASLGPATWLWHAARS